MFTTFTKVLTIIRGKPRLHVLVDKRRFNPWPLQAQTLFPVHYERPVYNWAGQGPLHISHSNVTLRHPERSIENLRHCENFVHSFRHRNIARRNTDLFLLFSFIFVFCCNDHNVEKNRQKSSSQGIIVRRCLSARL